MRNLLPRLGFIDETSLKTNMAKTTGWSPKGARLIDHAPFAHWNTQAFIAALRHDRLDAPWVMGCAMNRALLTSMSSHSSSRPCSKATRSSLTILPPTQARPPQQR